MDNYITPQKLDPIINKFCLTIGLIPTSYLISLTYEEQVLYIGKFIDENVIPALNNNAEAVAQLQEAFVNLKNYVDNLNLQDEVNNKLDEMVEDGTLNELVNDALSINVKYPLHSGGETATVNSITNIVGFEPPVAVSSIERALEYQNFDNVAQEIGFKDKSSGNDESQVFNGLVRSISDVGNLNVTISESLPDNYVKTGMFIVLSSTSPTNSNWTYVGRIVSYDENTNIITVGGWYNKTSGEMEIPTSVLFAWINPTTKFYGQHFDLTKNDSDKTSALIGSQMDFYGNSGGIIGYSPVVHNTTGQMAVRVRADGENGKWTAAFRTEGKEVGTGFQVFNEIVGTAFAVGENSQNPSTITDILKVNGASMIDGNMRFSELGLQISQGSANPNKAFWNLTADTNLTNVSAKQYHFYYVYNSSDDTITLTGTFRILNNQTLSKIDITSRNCVLLFAYNSSNYGVISTEMISHNQSFSDNFKNNIINFSGNKNLDAIFTFHKNNAGVYHFFTTAQSTLSSAYPIYLNGGSSANSVILAARSSGTIIYNNTTKSFYINSVQPS